MVKAYHCREQRKEESGHARRSGQQDKAADHDRNKCEEFHLVRHQHGQNKLLVPMLDFRLVLVNMMLFDVMLDTML